MVIWPKSMEPDFKLVSSFAKGDLWTETEMKMNLHTGTHIDSPLHCVRGGRTIDKLPLEEFAEAWRLQKTGKHLKIILKP